MKRSYSPNYGEPKYKSQSLVFDRLKVVFDDAIKEREELLSNQKNNENKNKICLRPKNINVSNNRDLWPEKWISI